MRSTGILAYDPQAKGIDPRAWWLILRTCPDLARYQRRWLKMFHRARFTVQKPAWNSHVSIVRGEDPPNAEAWGRHEGESVEFEYEQVLHTNGVHYWLEVECSRLSELRVELGLSALPSRPFHLTVGNNSAGEYLVEG